MEAPASSRPPGSSPTNPRRPPHSQLACRLPVAGMGIAHDSAIARALPAIGYTGAGFGAGRLAGKGLKVGEHDVACPLCALAEIAAMCGVSTTRSSRRRRSGYSARPRHAAQPQRDRRGRLLQPGRYRDARRARRGRGPRQQPAEQAPGSCRLISCAAAIEARRVGWRATPPYSLTAWRVGVCRAEQPPPSPMDSVAARR